ncbi:MAG: ATP-binding protein [Bacteroidales bacterium]|nr:ATP-binding protein [Bacteroidales bacterium]
MDKNIIKTIIGEKHHEISRIDLTTRPVKYEDAMSYVNVGIRRAGKSWLLYQDIQERIRAGGNRLEDILYINFEDERIADMTSQDLGLIIDCHQEMFGPGKPMIYLDEIQNIDGWAKFVRRLAESKHRIMVTGSNAKMLSKEVASTLGGSFVVREVLPFSWREYLSYHGVIPGLNWEFEPDTRLAVRRHFDDFFQNGGFAESFPLIGKREWLTSLLQKILLGDIVTRHKIRNDRQLRMLVRKVADNVMQPTAIARFEHIIKSTGEKISMPTVKDYLEYLEECYLVYSIPNYASPDSEQETLRKRYFMDNGLLNLYLYKGETKLLENLVALQLRRQWWNPEEPKLFYYKHGGVDLDFYVPEARMAIQASYNLAEQDTREREINALVDFNKAFPLERAVIVTYDQEETLDINGLTIEIIPAWKWLLQ